eukprot:Gb_24041 [translate_table: standard]
MTAFNTLLGEFHLSGIPKACCRVPSIEVTFDLDENGIIKASAEQKTAGLKTEVTIATDGSGLSTEEIDRMLKDAEKFRAEDEEAAKIHLAKKALEEYSYNAKNRFKAILDDNDLTAIRLKVCHRSTIHLLHMFKLGTNTTQISTSEIEELSGVIRFVLISAGKRISSSRKSTEQPGFWKVTEVYERARV